MTGVGADLKSGLHASSGGHLWQNEGFPGNSWLCYDCGLRRHWVDKEYHYQDYNRDEFYDEMPPCSELRKLAHEHVVRLKAKAEVEERKSRQ